MFGNLNLLSFKSRAVLVCLCCGSMQGFGRCGEWNQIEYFYALMSVNIAFLNLSFLLCIWLTIVFHFSYDFNVMLTNLRYANILYFFLWTG